MHEHLTDTKTRGMVDGSSRESPNLANSPGPGLPSARPGSCLKT